jgi:hypothetical protein
MHNADWWTPGRQPASAQYRNVREWLRNHNTIAQQRTYPSPGRTGPVATADPCQQEGAHQLGVRGCPVWARRAMRGTAGGRRTANNPSRLVPVAGARPFNENLHAHAHHTRGHTVAHTCIGGCSVGPCERALTRGRQPIKERTAQGRSSRLPSSPSWPEVKENHIRGHIGLHAGRKLQRCGVNKAVKAVTQYASPTKRDIAQSMTPDRLGSSVSQAACR